VGHERGSLRPVLILSQDVFNQSSGTVIAMAITSQPQKAGFPLTLGLCCPALPKKSWLKISQVRALSVARLQTKIGRATEDEIDEAVEGLNEILSGT